MTAHRKAPNPEQPRGQQVASSAGEQAERCKVSGRNKHPLSLGGEGA